MTAATEEFTQEQVEEWREAVARERYRLFGTAINLRPKGAIPTSATQLERIRSTEKNRWDD